jgi:hypothetical protein
VKRRAYLNCSAIRLQGILTGQIISAAKPVANRHFNPSKATNGRRLFSLWDVGKSENEKIY